MEGVEKGGDGGRRGGRRWRTENYDCYGCEIGGDVIAVTMLSANDDSLIRDDAA